MLACAVISDETTATKDWIAATPTVIMTDQDPAIIKSIKAMLHATTHKLCCWHMSQNLTKRVAGSKGNPSNALQTLRKLVHDKGLTETEFELEWSMVKLCSENDSSNSSSHRAASWRLMLA